MKAKGMLVLALAAVLALGSVGCGETTLRGEELAAELSAALDWDWLSDPTRAAVDMGLLTEEEAQRGVSLERLIEVRREIKERLDEPTWLHGFYAAGSYGQIELASDMDVVSLGWAKLAVDESGTPCLNQSSSQGNGWVLPESSHLATDYLEESNVPYHLCVFGVAGTVKECVGKEKRADTVAALVRAAEDYAGLTIDFEGLRGEELREDFSDFLRALRRELGEEKTLYVCVQPLTWFNGYDYRTLGQVCDKVILMAHDYQWLSVPEDKLGTADTDTPVAPLNHVYNALRDITDPETGVEDKSKIALAVSFASCGVEVDENGLLIGDRLYTPGMATLEQRLGQPEAEVTFVEKYQSPYVTYQNEEGRWFKVWYENEESVTAKWKLAKEFGIQGLSLWRLGSIPNGENYNVWQGLLQEMGK